jgi:hypothetical protein
MTWAGERHPSLTDGGVTLNGRAALDGHSQSFGQMTTVTFSGSFDDKSAFRVSQTRAGLSELPLCRALLSITGWRLPHPTVLFCSEEWVFR